MKRMWKLKENELNVSFETFKNELRAIYIPIPMNISIIEKYSKCNNCGKPATQLNICVDKDEEAFICGWCEKCDIEIK